MSASEFKENIYIPGEWAVIAGLCCGFNGLEGIKLPPAEMDKKKMITAGLLKIDCSFRATIAKQIN